MHKQDDGALVGDVSLYQISDDFPILLGLIFGSVLHVSNTPYCGWWTHYGTGPERLQHWDGGVQVRTTRSWEYHRRIFCRNLLDPGRSDLAGTCIWQPGKDKQILSHRFTSGFCTSSKMLWRLSLSNCSVDRIFSKLDNLSNVSLSPCASGPGMIVMRTSASLTGARRRTICVAKRVHNSLATGKDRPVSPSRSDDFPLDWSPTTTSWLQFSFIGRIVAIDTNLG